MSGAVTSRELTISKKRPARPLFPAGCSKLVSPEPLRPPGKTACVVIGAAASTEHPAEDSYRQRRVAPAGIRQAQGPARTPTSPFQAHARTPIGRATGPLAALLEPSWTLTQGLHAAILMTRRLWERTMRRIGVGPRASRWRL